jgi:hypothetical protein
MVKISTVSTIKTIELEPLFYNKLILDNNNNNIVFKLNRYKRLMPKTIIEVPTTPNSREREVIDNIRKIKIALNNINITNNAENIYSIMVKDKLSDISLLSFKDLYLKLLNDKNEPQEWEARWNNYLPNEEINWEEVWENVHDPIHSPYVKSAQWEMLHLNFWSGFKANDRCCLCRENEEGNTHIVNNCTVLKEIMTTFQIQDIFDDIKKISFGISKEPIKNFILYQIKTVVFRARFQIFPSIMACKAFLIEKCKKSIKNNLSTHFQSAKTKGNIDFFTRRYITNRQQREGNNNFTICSITQNNELIFTF